MREPETIDEAVAEARAALKEIRELRAACDPKHDAELIEDLTDREQIILKSLRDADVHGDF